MRRIQTLWLLIAACLLSIGGCSKNTEESNVKTVSQYLHDIDSARVAIKKYSDNVGQNRENPDFINALSARNKIQFLNDCWPKKEKDRFTTANTDHACLEKNGFKG